MKKVEIHPDAVEKVKKFTITDPQLGFGKYVAPIMVQALYDHGDWQRFDLLPYELFNLIHVQKCSIMVRKYLKA